MTRISHRSMVSSRLGGSGILSVFGYGSEEVASLKNAETLSRSELQPSAGRAAMSFDLFFFFFFFQGCLSVGCSGDTDGIVTPLPFAMGLLCSYNISYR